MTMMFCPRGCGIELAQANRQGVAIDYCPKCHGVWLDRGELDKIVEMSAQRVDHLMPPPGSHPGAPAPPSYNPAPHQRPADSYRHRDDDDDYYIDKHGNRRRRKESWLSDIFDFD